MLDPHTSAAIAQTVFYVPMVPVSIYVLVRNWRNRPRQAWLPLVGFSLRKELLRDPESIAQLLTRYVPVRLIGGPLVIAIPHDLENIGLIVTAIVFLNIGVFPLLVSTMGIFRIMYATTSSPHPFNTSRLLADTWSSSLSSSAWKDNRIHLVIKMMRLTILVQVALITAGSSMVGNSSTADTGRTLGKVAYFLVIFVLGLMSYLVLRLYLARDLLSASEHKVRLFESADACLTGLDQATNICSFSVSLGLRGLYSLDCHTRRVRHPAAVQRPAHRHLEPPLRFRRRLHNNGASSRVHPPPHRLVAWLSSDQELQGGVQRWAR